MDPQTPRDKLSSQILNTIRNSDKLQNAAVPSSGKFLSLSTGAPDFFFLVVLRVLLH